MKKKEFQHPCIYLKILSKNESTISVEYISNEFDESGNSNVKHLLRTEFLSKGLDIIHNIFEIARFIEYGDGG